MAQAQSPTDHADDSKAATLTRRTDRTADAVWRRLTEGLSASWLDEIRCLRAPGDNLDASLDIWSVALIAELKGGADRRDAASTVLARVRQLSDEIEGQV